MKAKILQMLFCLIIFMGCSRNDSDIALQENGIKESFTHQNSSRTDKEISYIPLWSAQKEYNGEMYIPLQTNKKIYPIIDGQKLPSINDDIWLRAVYKQDKWEFTILKVFPKDPKDKFKSGTVIFEDFKNGNFSYRDYSDSKFLINTKDPKKGAKQTKSSGNPMDEQPACKEVLVQVCAGDGPDMYCSLRLMVICENEGGTPNPGDPSTPPPLGGGSGLPAPGVNPEETDNSLSNEQQQQLLANKICSKSFSFTEVVPAGDGLPGWKETSLKGLTVSTISDSYFENIWTVVTTQSAIVTSTFNLEIGVSANRPTGQAATVAANAANAAMQNILKKYTYRATKRQMELGTFPSKFLAEFLSQLKMTYPEARASLTLSGRTTPKSPSTGTCN